MKKDHEYLKTYKRNYITSRIGDEKPPGNDGITAESLMSQCTSAL